MPSRTRDPNKPLSTLNVWMRQATTPEQEALAKAAGTTRGQLYQLANGHRKASPDAAHRLANASQALAKQSKGRLPELYVTDLCRVCAGCPYAQKALGNLALRGEFPVVAAE